MFLEKYFSKNIIRKILFEKYFSKNTFLKNIVCGEPVILGASISDQAVGNGCGYGGQENVGSLGATKLIQNRLVVRVERKY